MVADGVIYALFSFLYEFIVIKQVAEAKKAVGVISGLLISPPVPSVISHARDISCPKTCIVRVRKGLRMACEAFFLGLQLQLEPSFRLDVPEARLLPRLRLKDGAGKKESVDYRYLDFDVHCHSKEKISAGRRLNAWPCRQTFN